MLTRGLRVVAQRRHWHPPHQGWQSHFGDYPKMPWTSIDERSPYQRWDDPVNRRNFGEPIPEEFEIQDAFFPGDHTPVDNLKTGLYGQAWVVAIAAFFGAIAYGLAHTKKPMRRDLPDEVQKYLDEAGWDRVVKRPYEPVATLPFDTFSEQRYTPAKSTSHH